VRRPALSLERALEAALATGVLASGLLLVVGLLLGASAPLRWGIVLLMLTPVARIATLTLGLGLQRDWPFVAVSLWVLGVMLTGILLSLRL
jgi:uncharacterized membrane protein